VRLDARGFDPLAASLHLQRLFSTLTADPPSLQPAAILCIRRMSDPLPGQLQLRSQELRPPPRWERALIGAVDDTARRAARPALGPAPAYAEAVLFADRAEMLACLADDIRCGRAAGNWWWRSLIGNIELGRLASMAFAASPEHVPAAFERLAIVGRAAEAVERFNETVALHLLALVCERFGLSLRPSDPGATPVVAGQVPARLAVGIAIDAEVALTLAPAGPVAALPPPWRPFIAPHELGTLDGARRALLVVALLVQRAPLVIRSPAFVAELERHLWASPPAPLARDDYDVASVESRPPATAPVRPLSGPDSAAARSPAGDRRGAVSAPTTGSAPPGAPPPLAIPARVVAPASPSALPAIDETSAIAAAAPAVVARDEPPRPAAAVDAAPTTRAAEPVVPAPLPRPFGAAVTTQLGGLFYLVNVALRLGLFPDFTQPAAPGLAMPIWDFVALIGADLLGGEDDDPIWVLLADLARRAPDEPPGAGFVAPDDWELPADWLAAFPATDRWRRSLAAAAQGSWLERMRAFMRARLLLGLGLEIDDEIAPLLLRRRARVHVTDVHVDVVLPLAELPIEVRIAGLDRDVGWLPSAGRYLAFHFE